MDTARNGAGRPVEWLVLAAGQRLLAEPGTSRILAISRAKHISVETEGFVESHLCKPRITLGGNIRTDWSSY